jgi:predicted secreted protein
MSLRTETAVQLPIPSRTQTTAEKPYERRGAAWEFSTDTSLIQVTVDQLGVALLKINQPETKNAPSQRLVDSLVSAFAMAERDPKVKVVLTERRTAGPFSGTRWEVKIWN